MRRAAQIVLINGLVFCGLFLSLEVSYRVWLYFRNCDTICRNPAFLTRLDASTVPYGFLVRDPIVGYLPADGDYRIHYPGWNANTVTIRNGVRSSGNAAPPAVGAILALGDSFVFGDQVSDHETWPAILERLSGHRVVNGGVSGYGTAQALLHGTQLLSTAPYSLVILSILVDADLVRDRIAYVQPRVRRPIVIRDGDAIRQTTAQEQNAIGSSLCDLFWSQIAKRFLSELDRCRINDPRAATVEDIIEYVVAQLAALPMKKMILLQYTHVDGTMPDQATKIREAANRHGVPVIDTRAALMREPHQEIYKGTHHSMRGNEIVARVIAGELEQ